MLDLLAGGMSVEIPVTGESMSPLIRGSDVVTLAPVLGRDVRLGDVVAFPRPDGRLVIHRVVALEGDRLRTRGDAVAAADAWMDRQSLIGRVEKVDRDGQETRWGLGPARPWLALLSHTGLLRPLMRPIRWLVRIQPAISGEARGMRTNVAVLFLFLVAVFSAAAFGALFTPGEWYQQLAKPAWNPPSWLFGPVWSVLYVMIAVSGWLVWKRGGAPSRTALIAWGVQLALNAAWSWIFFGMQRMGAALIEILVLWLAILVTVVLFWRLRRLAAVLLLPYLLWVSFAATLNWKLWQLNG